MLLIAVSVKSSCSEMGVYYCPIGIDVVRGKIAGKPLWTIRLSNKRYD